MSFYRRQLPRAFEIDNNVVWRLLLGNPFGPPRAASRMPDVSLGRYWTKHPAYRGEEVLFGYRGGSPYMSEPYPFETVDVQAAADDFAAAVNTTRPIPAGGVVLRMVTRPHRRLTYTGV